MKLIYKLLNLLFRSRCKCCEMYVKHNNIHHYSMELYGYSKICNNCVEVEAVKRDLILDSLIEKALKVVS